ncbi:hypothetical protein [Streptomyces sp. NPDC014734]|uniref:hypothetical protein n=1 Tax=Streptomyces sp. NPDC014734 TaxID=3364886 RepID=UPI0036F7A448
MMWRHVKLSAVLVVVVLALTGFSSSGHGSRSGKSKSRSGGSSGSSGGGCSNSKKSNGGYHSSVRDNDYGSSSGSSDGDGYGTDPTPAASDGPTAYVFRCARPGKGKRKAVTAAAVRLTANALGSRTYEVDVTFLDARGNTVDTGEAEVRAQGGETRTVSVRMEHPRKVSQVKNCRVEAEASH